MQISDNIEAIARSFVAARAAGRALSAYPGRIPEQLSDAYRVQDLAMRLNGGTVAGWKVGRINPAFGGVDRLAGPIFVDQVIRGHEGSVTMPVFADGFAAAEAEFLLRIGTSPDPDKRTYTVDEAAALIDAVHVGIEIASSPFNGINDNGPGVTISDFGNNNGLVIGPAIEEWRDVDLNLWPVELAIDGATVGVGRAAEMLDGPFGAARFLFELMAARRIALSAGQWISSGAVTGVHRVSVGDVVEARFDGRLVTGCTISAH